MSAGKKRGARALLLALEIVGAALALAAGLAGLLFWRLQSGPVSLSLFTRSAEFAIEKALPPGHRARIETATLSRGAARGDFAVSLDAIAIDDAARARVADLVNVTLGFSLEDVLRGEFGPRSIRIVDPTLRIKRGTDRRFTLDYAETESASERGDVFELLTGGPVFRGAFEQAELVGATVFFEDAVSGRAWRADAAEAAIVRHPDGYAARLDGVFDVDGEKATMRLDATYLETTGIITAEIDVVEAPLGDVIEMFYGERFAVLAAPVSGRASIMLTREGRVISSRLEGRAAEGVLQLGARRLSVALIDVIANFDPAENRFDIERFNFDIDGSRGRIGGAARLEFAGDARAPASITADLEASELVIDAKELLPEPLPVATLTSRLVYDFEERRISLDALRADLLGAAIVGAISVAPGPAGASPAIAADLKIEGAFDRDRLLRAWPTTLGGGARDFVATRLPRADISNVAFVMDLPAGAKPAGGPMPDEAMRLTFDIAGATAIYAPTMTPITAASGAATLTGNRFVIERMRGRVGAVALSEGEIDFTALSPRGAPTRYAFTASGAARDMLAILDQPPLEALKASGLAPERFASGAGRARIEIIRPNLRDVPREDYVYKGSATFRDVTIAEFWRGIDLEAAAGEVALTSGALVISGEAGFGGAPITIEWSRRLGAGEAGSRFRVAGLVDSSTGDVFGVPTRQFLRGPVRFAADATGDVGALDTLRIEADFAEAALSLDAIGWAKAEGVRAEGMIDLAFSDAGAEVRAARIDGEGVALEGAASFAPDGAIRTAAFERLRFDGGADLSLSLARTATGGVDLALTGAYLNAGPLAKSLIEAGAPASGEADPDAPGLSIRARIDSLDLRAGARYRDAALDFVRSGGEIQALSFSARTAAGAPLSMVLAQTGAEAGPAQSIEARTDDIGALLSGLFGIGSIRGGQGSMRIDVEGPEADEGLSGSLAARGMRVVEAPLLARVFAAGSLDGLVDLLNGEGIALSEAFADFTFRDGVLALSGARATGPSVGITVEGSMATGPGAAVDLHGALAPAYQVNSFLGNAPLIGDLFVNRAGEGLVALSYDVRGQADAPLVSVNPLSALTPGFLRRIFETPPREAPEAGPDED